MNRARKGDTFCTRGAALLIVLAFVVLLTGLSVAYLSRTTSDRQVAHGSFNQSKADQFAASAMDNIIGDLRQEIRNGSVNLAPPSATPAYSPSLPAYMVPQRSGNVAAVPNLIRRSVSPDSLSGNPGLPSRASAVNSAPADPSNPQRGEIALARWNKHYLIPRANASSNGNYESAPIGAFTAPDWVFVTSDPANRDAGRRVITAPDPLIIGRYAYAVYDESGLLDMNVAGYPNDPSAAPIPAQRVGRKGSVAYADLTALGNYPIPNGSGGSAFQVDKIVGWRNYATTQPNNFFPDSNPPAQAFARNFQTSTVPATNFYNYAINNTSGFLSTSTTVWSPTNNNNALRTDQSFVQRQELIAIGKTLGFSSNALQYLSTFSRETNSPSSSPTTATTVNPNFLLSRVTTAFTRFDGTAAVVDEPLVKTRFPLSRLAWITYKGPSASLATTDAVYTAFINAGVSATTIAAGTAANIQACFGLTFPAGGAAGSPWTYTNHTTPSDTTQASRILRLDEVAALGQPREPDFFELLQAGILSGSLGQNTGGGVTGGNVFPDIHMNSTTHHILSIGAAIIDQADPDSVPTRIQFTGTNGNTWTAYGVESLPYITQIYPITGTSPANPAQWATYLLFQLWNPHVGGALLVPAPQVRLRVDGNVGVFTGGNGQTWSTDPTHNQTSALPAGGVSIALTTGAFPQTLPTPAPLGTPGVAIPVPGVGSASAPAGFERLPGTGGNSLTNYVGLRLLPDYTLTPATSGNNPQLTLYLGTDATHQFNATMEYTPDAGTTWVPYNRFIGLNDATSWITGDTIPVRNASALNGTPGSGDAFDNNAVNRLRDSALPDCLMKADPRATRFGIFQFRAGSSWTTTRVTDPLWPTGNSIVPNGYGGTITDPAPPSPTTGIVEHAPLRFSTSGGGNGIYFPATLCINNAASTSTTTSYADGDGVIRPADATYPDPSVATTGSSTPYYSTSTDYHPIILNRPFRNVADLGYTFRDLPWKTLDFFSENSADAGLLDIFTINDGAQVLDANGSIVGMAPPTTVAGSVNLNGTQAADLQSVFAGAILDELDATNAVFSTGTSATAAPVLAANVVNATSTTPMRNRSELITRSGLPTSILPVPLSGAAHNQRVKSRREGVARAIASLSQTRTWNLLLDLVAQAGHYKPNAQDLRNDFVVEGEQHYWVHVAIDRFTGQVLDKQIEVVNE